MVYPKLLGSSVDPEKLALTVVGILGFLLTGILYLGSIFGANISSSEVQPFIDAVGTIIKDVGLLVSTGITAYGAIRKVIVAYQNRKQL